MKDIKEEDLKKVTGGGDGKSLDQIRQDTLRTLNRYLILPQATLDFINTTTDQACLVFLDNFVSFHALIKNSSAEKGFVMACKKYNIPYEGYIVK